MAYEELIDPSNPFETEGLSREDKALLDYILAARAAKGVDIVCTSSTDHPTKTASGGISRHRQQGTGGLGLALDIRMRTRSEAPNFHDAAFDIFVPVERNLFELIYAYAPYNIKSGARTKPYAVSDHKNHVHVSVNRGVFVAYPVPRTPQEAHMLFNGTNVVAVPNRPARSDGRWAMWGWKPDGSVFCWNFTPDMVQHVPTPGEKGVITGNGATVIALWPRTDGVFGYILVTNDADDRGGLATYTF